MGPLFKGPLDFPRLKSPKVERTEWKSHNLKGWPPKTSRPGLKKSPISSPQNGPREKKCKGLPCIFPKRGPKALIEPKKSLGP